jgi:hypothetical protein
MVDENLRRGFILSRGSIMPFFASPISFVLIAFIFFTLFGRTKPVRAVMGFIFRPLRAILPQRYLKAPELPDRDFE